MQGSRTRNWCRNPSWSAEGGWWSCTNCRPEVSHPGQSSGENTETNSSWRWQGKVYMDGHGHRFTIHFLNKLASWANLTMFDHSGRFDCFFEWDSFAVRWNPQASFYSLELEVLGKLPAKCEFDPEITLWNQLRNESRTLNQQNQLQQLPVFHGITKDPSAARPGRYRLWIGSTSTPNRSDAARSVVLSAPESSQLCRYCGHGDKK